jgi:glycosyltransferase involved in cell wall biosynthesis
MSSQLRASIIIATYKRADCLPKCLEALAALETDPTTFEIIVVDNNSPDNTRNISLEFAETHPALQVRYMLEKKQGASHARNRGVAEASGEIVCFVDDDSPPSPEWLNILLETFNDPHVGCAGGPSIPDYQGQEVPAWLRGDLQGLLSGYTLPYTKPAPVSRWDQLPLSCNMAIRRSLFADLGFLRTDLDRSGGQVLAAGDTEMADRINKAGWKVMYIPDAPVRHLVAPERLQKNHIYRIGRGLAASHVILTADPRPHKILRWFASDVWYATRMFFAFVFAIMRGKTLWFDDYMRFWMVAQRIPFRAKHIWEGRSNGPTKVEPTISV